MDVLSDIKALAVAKGEQVQAWKEEQGVIKADYDELTAAVSALSVGDLDKEIIKLTSLSGAEMPDEVKKNLLSAVKSTEEAISAVTSLGAKTFQNTDIVYCRTLPVSGTSLSSAFEGCHNLFFCESLTLSEIKSVSGMFSECACLTHAELSGMDSVTDMSNMFANCGALTTVTLSDGLSNVTTMFNSFIGCTSLQEITFPDGSLTALASLVHAFDGCKSLTNVSFASGSLAKVTSLHDCFNGCTSLSSLTLPEGSMAAVTSMIQCFNGCTSLSSLTLPEGSMSAVTSMSQCFSSCSSLSSLTLPEGSMSAVTNMGQCFYGCSSLSSLTLPEGSLKENLTAYLMLSGCSKLTKVENFTLQGVALTTASYTDSSAYNNAIDFRPPSSLVDFEYSGTLYRSGVTLKNCPNLTAKSLFSWAAALYDWETNSESLTTDDTEHVLYMTAAQQATLIAYEGDGTMTGEEVYEQLITYGWELSA